MHLPKFAGTAVMVGATALGAPAVLGAQEVPAPRIDTIIVITDNVFSPEEVAANGSYAVVNGLRFKTRRYVVRRELLFRRGESFDLLKIAETARNLRALGLFRQVEIDTSRVDGRFAVIVRTRDAWSTQIQLNAASTGGTFTWSAGITENNFLGTGDAVSLVYRKGIDRNTVTVGARTNRLFGTRLSAAGAYQSFSDGRGGTWLAGLPFRSLTDRHSVQVFGEAAARQVLQFRTRAVDDVDTTRYWRRVFRNGLVAAVAPVADNSRYLRVGLALDVRREEYVLVSDTALFVPDSVFSTVGVFAEYQRARFRVVRHFNGFGTQEDLNLSTTVRVTARVAPSPFGYERSGIGPGIVLFSGWPLPNGYVRGSISAHGVFDAGGLDSGAVDVSATVALKFSERQATFLHFVAGAQQAPVPGGEYDLGVGVGPRSFGPHAFSGTRTVWGTFEHRWFVVDDLLDVLGLGLATFLDYGGAWYADRPSRFGGNVGAGLRFGFNRSSGANTGRLDLGYRFGEGFGKRWVVSFGRGFVF